MHLTDTDAPWITVSHDGTLVSIRCSRCGAATYFNGERTCAEAVKDWGLFHASHRDCESNATLAERSCPADPGQEARHG